MVYTNNNPLAYVQECKLEACQIRWLSELALFNFQICYHSESSYRAADALSCHPTNPDSSSENDSDSEAEVAISYGLSCSAVQDIIDPHLGGTWLPMDIRFDAQSIGSVLEEHQEESPIDVCTHETSVSDMVQPATMTEEQKKDLILGVLYQYVDKGTKPKPSAIVKIPSKSVSKYHLQFDWMTLKKDCYIIYTSTMMMSTIN